MGRTTRHMVGGVVVLVLAVVLGLATGEGPLFLGGGNANAVVGRPLTPVSYAGVARRTTRRTVRRTAYATGGYYAAPAVPAAAVVTTLPAGCVQSGPYYACGAVRYEPYYSGTTLVYRQL